MAETLLSWLNTAPTWILLGLGFGFIIFWHELGHFLAAKYVGIRVEQFAVGFGQAVVSWRKGLGLRLGSTRKDYEHVVKAHLAKTHAEEIQLKEKLEWSEESFIKASDELGISATEYRLNWIPLGGYVKMLGQDDMKPGAEANDPNAYNRKSIGARMLVVSAGVIMNIILAAVGFMVVFLVGFDSPPAVVGAVVPGSPAQVAGLTVGDRILTFDDAYQYDFTKVQLATALADPTKPASMSYRTPDGAVKQTTIEPERNNNMDVEFLQLGVAAAMELRGIDASDYNKNKESRKLFNDLPEQAKLVKPGETIVAINGVPVTCHDLSKLDADSINAKVHDLATLNNALQNSGGKPVPITVRAADGATRLENIIPIFAQPFNASIHMYGLQPRPQIGDINEESSAKGKLMPGDIVLAVGIGNDRQLNPSQETFVKLVSQAGDKEQKLSLTVLRDGKKVEIDDLLASYRISRGRTGLGVGLAYALDNTTTAQPVDNSSGSVIPGGSQIVAVNGKAISNWRDIREALRNVKAGEAVTFTAMIDGKPVDKKVTPSTEEVAKVANLLYTHQLMLHQMVEPRKTKNPLVAAAWGVTETRDAVMQVYLTIKRISQGDISYKNVSGPVGIFAAGYKFADRGAVWLTWFLAIISANLAVMNFLPIPIVDGGLFTFLIIEKIKGRPVSPRVQAVAQVVGLAILLSVFLLATYQDIARWTFLIR